MVFMISSVDLDSSFSLFYLMKGCILVFLDKKIGKVILYRLIIVVR